MRFFLAIVIGWGLTAGFLLDAASTSLRTSMAHSATIVACTTDAECCDLNPESCE